MMDAIVDRKTLPLPARYIKILTLVFALAVAVIVFVSYHPAIKVGFLGDDWWFVGKAASLSLSDYLAFYFDPRAQLFWYRPLYGIILLVEYAVFGGNPEGYHLAQIAIHFINCLLLSAILWRLSRRWMFTGIAATLYASLAVHSEAIVWIAVQDPLALVFNLAAIWFWIGFLGTRSKGQYFFAYGMTALSLLSKETSIVLPVTLFMVDRLLVRKNVSVKELLQWYTPFAALLLPYVAVEYYVQTHSLFPNEWGYGIGSHMLVNAAKYMALVVFPWGLGEPLNYIYLAISALLLVALTIRQQSGPWVFLAIEALLAILPAIGFPTVFFSTRYLYTATAISAILYAALADDMATRLSRFRWATPVFCLALVAVIVLNSAMTSRAASAEGELARQMRVPFRDISQQHPTYPPDTFLYFVDFPFPYITRNLTGMFYLRYGSNVTVSGTDGEARGAEETRAARLHDHQNSFVYYLDESMRRREIAAGPISPLTASVGLPVKYKEPIRLESYEVTTTALKRGEDFAVLLYWRAVGAIDKDYTVFIHVENERGETIFGSDSVPRNGRAPTSLWKPGKLVADTHILTVPREIGTGMYRLGIGLYSPATLERLLTVNEEGSPIADTLVIQPFSILD